MFWKSNSDWCCSRFCGFSPQDPEGYPSIATFLPALVLKPVSRNFSYTAIFISVGSIQCLNTATARDIIFCCGEIFFFYARKRTCCLYKPFSNVLCPTILAHPDPVMGKTISDAGLNHCSPMELTEDSDQWLRSGRAVRFNPCLWHLPLQVLTISCPHVPQINGNVQASFNQSHRIIPQVRIPNLSMYASTLNLSIATPTSFPAFSVKLFNRM